MWLSKLVPEKFLWRFPLQNGALFVGCVTLVISMICVIVIAVEIVYYKECKDCTGLVIRNAYSFSINAVIYCVIMIFVNSWFIWGVKCGKSSVVLSWVVISSVWWAQSSLLVFILLCLLVTDTSMAWIVAVVCAIIAFNLMLIFRDIQWNSPKKDGKSAVIAAIALIFGYFILVVYGHWLDIRKSSETRVEETRVEEPRIEEPRIEEPRVA